MSEESLRGVITPASLGVMTPTKFTPGQKVRYIGRGHTINHGAIGTVVRMEEVLDDCPVVNFPNTHGPYNEFLFIAHNRDLEIVEVAA